jgi:hypothetical protein
LIAVTAIPLRAVGEDYSRKIAMHYRIPWAMALGVIIALRLGAADDPKPEVKSLKDAPEVETKSKDKWTAVGEYTGTLKKMSGDWWTVHVQYKEMQTDQKAQAADAKIAARIQQQMASVQRQLAAANNIKNPAQRMAKIQQIMASAEAKAVQAAMGQKSPFKLVDKQKDIDVMLAKEVTVRVKEPPAEFDDKGVAKKYTQEELKKLKGPGNYWGYPAEFNAAEVGATVHVYLYKKKTNKTAKPKSKDGDDVDDDDSKDAHVKVVYILKESTQKKTDKK